MRQQAKFPLDITEKIHGHGESLRVALPTREIGIESHDRTADPFDGLSSSLVILSFNRAAKYLLGSLSEPLPQAYN